MSGKITDTFHVVKKTETVAKSFPQKKVKNEAKVKADQQRTVFPVAKDVRDLNILQDFDLRCEYGPCIGISRLERWTRAQNHGLDPPPDVKKIIEEHANDIKFTQCLWYEEELL